jgi:alpha-1,3-mannosyltransferase
VEAIRYVGPEHCAISIVEGDSPDGTSEVLAALKPVLERLLGSHRVHFVLGNGIRPLEGEGMRFKKLAELRNMALRPMLDGPEQHKDATVVFINDVAICLEDILELIHQRHYLSADMTCAMDWIPGGDGPIFYDSYISRSIGGDLFFNIPPETASYSEATNLFWNEPVAKERMVVHQPFQVFSCWNGAVAFTASPVVEKKVAFRATYVDKGECLQAEPELFCKDMWWQGYGRIAVVPSVNLGYSGVSNEEGKMAKEKKGYTSDLVGKSTVQEKIDWGGPPPMVKCMPTFTDQTWRPWNESLG